MRFQPSMAHSPDPKSIDDEASDEYDNDSLSWSLRTRGKKKQKKRKRGFDEASRVLETKKRFKGGFDETLDEMSVQDSDDDDDENSRVLEEDLQSGLSDEEVDDDEWDTEGSAAIKRFKVGDIVWAKALPYTWWPGWIRKRDHFRVLISFFGLEGSQRFKVWEIRSFEKNFSSMSKLVQWSFLDAVDIALAELGRRIVLGLMCPCQGTWMEEVNVEKQHLVKKSVIVKKMEFQPKAVLAFVLRMAVCPWNDDAETISVVRSGAQVSAFRRYVFLPTDWIYRETMRLSESGSTSDDDSEEANMKMTREAEFSEDEQEGKHEVLTQQVEMHSGISKKDRVEPLHELLTHLCCLALDPFYAGPEGSGSMCQKILNYRKLVYHKVLDKVPVKHTSDHGHEVESSKVQEISRLDLVSHLNHVTTGTLTEKRVGTRSADDHVSPLSNVRIQHCDMACIKEKSKGVMLDCISGSSGELSAFDPMVKDFIALVKDIPDHDNEAVTDKVQEVTRVEETVAHLINTATKTEHGYSFAVANGDAHGYHLSSHGKHDALTRQVERDSGICKKDKVEPLHEFLTHLCCLALDPFYAGPEGSSSMCKKILNYRKLVYGKFLYEVPVKHTFDHGHEVGISKVQEISGLDLVSHLNHVTARTLTEKSVGTRSADGIHVSPIFSNVRIQHYDMAGIKEKSKDVIVECISGSPGELSALDPMVKDSIALVKDIPYHDDEAVTGKLEEVTRVEETVALLINSATKTEHGYTLAVAKDDTHGCHLSSHGREDTTKNDFDGKSMDVKDDCSLGFIMEVSPSEPVFNDAIKTHSDDSSSVANCETSESLSDLGDYHILIHPRNKIGAAESITDKEVILEMVSEDKSEEKRRLSQPASSGFSSEFHKARPLYPPNPVSSGNTRSLSSMTNSLSDQPTSLHMKFPKDFKLPSKDALVKQFRPFGPLDSSRTKVFFYTGSAQVVFLCKLDAEAAYHFAKRRKLFYGDANIRFWMDRHENSRRTNKIPSALSFSTVGSSALNLKSCLRTSSIAQAKNDEIKKNRVKFLPESPIFSSSDSMTTSGAFIPSHSCNFSREVGPDISVQMLVLLENCNQLVCKTKENLGVQSYYSLFTHNYSNIPNLDDE